MDERQRLLERRWRETGCDADQGLWLRDRVRSGDVAEEDLRLLMLVGHAGARSAVAGWEPSIPPPKDAEGEILEPGQWTKRTPGAEASSRYDTQHQAMELQLRYEEFNVSECVPDVVTYEEIRTKPSSVLQAEIVGRLEIKLRDQLARAGRLPLVDLAYALEHEHALRRLILVGYLVARHTLPLYERVCAGSTDAVDLWTAGVTALERSDRRTVSLEARHPDGGVEKVPLDGEHLSEAGMVRFNIPTAPRAALKVVEMWLLESTPPSMNRVAVHYDHLRLFMATPPARQEGFPDGPPNMVLMLLHLIRRLEGTAPFAEEPWPAARYLGNIFREGRQWAKNHVAHAPRCTRPQGSNRCRCGLEPGDRWLVANVIRPGLSLAILGA